MRIRVRTFSDSMELEKFLDSIPENNIMLVTESSTVVGYSTRYHYTVIYKSRY